MIANEHLKVVLPLQVAKDSWSGVTMWTVRTEGGFTVGSRLLKGVSPPSIEDFGPFETEAEAEQLAERLTRHIKEDWPTKKRRKKR